MSFSSLVTYDTASHFSFDATKVEVSGGLIRLKDLGGGTYSTANPIVDMQYEFSATTLSTLAESVSTPAGSAVQYQLWVNGSYYWYNGTTWAAGDGTYATSNTAATLNSNLATLNAALGLNGGYFVRIRAFLNSAAGTARPSLTSNTFTGANVFPTPATISICTISGYLRDILNNVPTYDATKPVTFNAFCDKAFYHGASLVLPFTKSAAFDNTGFVTLPIIETATPGQKLSFFLTYWDGRSRHSVKLYSAVVPNQASITINNLSLTRDVDFG